MVKLKPIQLLGQQLTAELKEQFELFDVGSYEVLHGQFIMIDGGLHTPSLKEESSGLGK